jgi:muramoyltetrapeptide carboxypeptidase LdcA involved in peptidoglycan recycling
VIIDADIGHIPPNLNLINGALCTVTADVDQGKVISASVVTKLA